MASIWQNKFFEKSKSQLSHLVPPQKHNKTYIIPTKFGFCFAGLLLVLLYCAFASGNNFLYLYTFFLASVGFTSLWLTHINLADVNIESLEFQEAFADSPTFALANIYNSSTKSRAFIEVSPSKENVTIIPEIPAKAFYQARIEFGTFPRGSHAVPKLQLSTTFPFFLLHSWKVYRSNQEFVVFPKREGTSTLPFQDQRTENEEGRKADRVRSVDLEFAGHRKFETSDSIRQVDWKAYARTERMLVKDYQGYRPQEVQLQWEGTLMHQDFEARLSQLALWIEIAESKGFHYSLKLPHEYFQSGRGRIHYLNCLKSLALFRKDGSPET